MNKVTLIVIILIGFALACKKETVEPEIQYREVLELPDQPYQYADVEFPDHFSSAFLDLVGFEPGDNPITNEGATLGRVLFYDKQLSANRSTSCGSCHHQEKGFADFGPTSEGFDGGFTGRNSMHLVNLRYNRRMFWDLRASNLEAQVLMPIEDPLEMGMTLEGVIERLDQTPHYAQLFDAAFGSTEINEDRISKALAQFVRSIVSYESKWDEAQENDYANFTELELLGRDMFFNNQTRCNQCHMTSNFYQTNAFNTGLESNYSDPGQYSFTGNDNDIGQFKVPSLRNVEITGPYMHDGRFETLEEVVEQYNSGVQSHPNLDDRLTEEIMIGGTPLQMNLTEEEKEALVAFMLTLTDHQMMQDPKWSDPFVLEPF